MSRENRESRDLAALLRDLETTLTELQDVVDEADRSSGDGDHRRRDERPRDDGRPAPPQPADVARFTEQYTIPTAISVLEATIDSLEMLGGLLRLADPDRSSRDRTRRPGGRQRLLEDGIEDLRRALTATEEPPDSVARDVLGEARALTEEIEARLDEARRPDRARADRSDRVDPDRGVVIPVDDEDEAADSDRRQRRDEAGDDADEAVSIDVDAELQSIRDEVHGATDEEDREAGESGSEDEIDGGDGDESGDYDAR